MPSTFSEVTLLVIEMKDPRPIRAASYNILPPDANSSRYLLVLYLEPGTVLTLAPVDYHHNICTDYQLYHEQTIRLQEFGLLLTKGKLLNLGLRY